MQPPRAPEMDRILHAERLDGHAKRSHSVAAKALPDGALIDQDGQAWLVRGNNILLWTFGGYTLQQPFQRGAMVTVLTPPSILACLSMGYKSSDML